MFTMRYLHHDAGYKSYSVVSYEVAHQADGTAEIDMSRKLNGQDSFREFVGDREQFRICYITNVEGKTIDVIKMAVTKDAT